MCGFSSYAASSSSSSLLGDIGRFWNNVQGVFTPGTPNSQSLSPFDASDYVAPAALDQRERWAYKFSDTL